MEHAKNSIVVLLLGVLLISNLSCSNSKVQELNQQLQQKNEEYSRLKNDFQSTQDLNDKQYEELITIQKELTKLDSLSLTLRYGVEHGQKTSYTMQEEIDALICKIKEDIKQKNELIKEQTKTEKKLRIFIESLTLQLDNKVKEIDKLKKDLMQRDQIISIQNTKIDGLEISKNKLENQIENLEWQKKKLEQDMLNIKGEVYYNIGIALENAASNIPELTGIFISGAKKDEVIKTKVELRQQAREYFKKSASFGYKEAFRKL